VTPTSPPGTGPCTATYKVVNQWPGGFQGEVTVTAGASAIGGWTVTWRFANGESVDQSWNATISSQGGTVTAGNVSYNGSLPAGGSTTFGFLGSSSGTPGTPSLTCTAS
jgi:cellulase/cellobiase CelA1